MGGFGSGNRYRIERKKTTVEDALRISIWKFCKSGYLRPHGRFVWTWTPQNQASLDFTTTYETGEPSVVLHYCCSNGEDVRLPIALQTTPTQFGGKRWWFTCPLLKDGKTCGRRVGKLYIPPCEKYFGCRQCHNLTYDSCQQSHLWQRLMASGDSMKRWLAAHDDES